MADEEPPQQSIQARIAALNVGQVGRAPITATQSKRPVPTPPAIKRAETTSVTLNREVGNLPNGAHGRQILPAPTGIIRTGQVTGNRSNGSRAKPPPPPRPPPRSESTSARPSPSLPPRTGSSQVSRRGSQESISSVISSVSGMSTATSNSNRAPSFDSGRIRAPVYDPASLPPLPNRPAQERETGRPPLKGRQASVPVITDVKKQAQPPALPQRGAIGSAPQPAKIIPAPPQPPRRPTANGSAPRSSLGNGKPSVTVVHVQDLGPSDFDSVVFAGKQTFVEFILPYCPYCKCVVDIYEELARSFSYAADQITIAKVDASVHKALAERFGVESYPTFAWFDGTSDMPDLYQYQRELEPLTQFVTEKTGLKGRTYVPPSTQQKVGNEIPSLPARRLPPTTIPPLPSRSLQPSTLNSQDLSTSDLMPPPVPKSTRPDLSKILATKPKLPALQTVPTSGDVCLKCRDFSIVDAHAATFPRQSIPSIDWLASQLCDTFPSRTDKARAIFNWLHHNVAYDVVAFFNNNVQRSTPVSTLQTGLAVCEGYAALFVSIAVKAGLEAVLVSGHGKGFGYTPMGPNDPVPRENPSGHAWAVVKIDDDKWKLCDPCWGAGTVGGKGEPYKPGFNPAQFVMTNDEFGTRHFPSDPRHFYRDDGRPTLSWEEYMRGKDPSGREPVTVYGQCKREGFDDQEFLPKHKHISTDPASHADPVLRFQFQRLCPHWDPMRNGPGAPYLYFLLLGKPANGGKADKIVFETNGLYWWVDVPLHRLGAKGEQVKIYALDKFNGRDGRGLTRRQFEGERASGWNMSFLALWELV